MTDKKTDNYLNQSLDIYLFGSAIYSITPNDIDLLVVYDAEKVSIQEALDFRKDLGLLIANIFNLPSHICLLSNKEKEYRIFITQERAVKIYPIAQTNRFTN